MAKIKSKTGEAKPALVRRKKHVAIRRRLSMKQISKVLPPLMTDVFTWHVGHPRGLQKATAALPAWTEESGLQWQMDGKEWAGRVEWYLTNPETEPDTRKWETELAFLTTSAAGRQA